MDMIANVRHSRPLVSKVFWLERQVFEIEKWVCVVALWVMLLAIISSVLVRYFQLPFPNLSEWGVVAMAPLTFIGMAMCSYLGAHIAVDLVKSVGRPGVQRVARFITGLATVVFATVYLQVGWTFFRGTFESGERLIDMGTPVALPLFFLPAGMVLVLFHTALEIWRTIRDLEAVHQEQE
ncbi:TRAP transporter small permease [Hydrogenophaga sp.]|jgi:TRAP-type C4-dicarboxylate transport system permease small subunit|uniref:TRAP transporter small permease n=1 Tax=Hydrogenophaga sp. TaxID=1904254 RepID=UPI003F6FF8B8